MSNHPNHPHSHSIEIDTPKAQKALIKVLLITLFFFFIEVIGGFWTGSIALLSDAGHMFTDIAALSFSLFAIRFSSREATLEKSYGFHRFETLAAFINSVFLMFVASSIFFEAIERLQQPHPVRALPMLLIALVGLGVNIVGFLILSRYQEHSLNIRGALLHVIGDMLGSIGAIIAGIIIFYTNWVFIDAIVSIFICILILIGSWNLLWKSTHVLMEGVPEGLDQEALKKAMFQVEGVREICDLHIWSLNSNIPMLTAHVIIQDLNQSKEILLRLVEILKNEYKIEHVTLQLEDKTFPSCGLIV